MPTVVETGLKPALGSFYGALWTRDHAYTVWHDPSLVTAAQLREFVAHRLAKRSTVSTGHGYADFIPDRIATDGTVTYLNPGASERPFMDGIAFVVLALWTDWHATGNTATFTANKATIDACLAAVPRSANGCVYSDPTAPSVDYGFTDTVLKTGDVAYGTALQAWAYKMLAQIAGENGSGPYTTLFLHACDGLATLRQASGWYKASSGNNAAKDDVWATALAVAEGLITTPADQIASAVKLRDAYLDGSIVHYGWVRHLPEGQYWVNTTTAGDEYQNGGYWLTPLWDCYRAVALVDRIIAREWVVDALNTVQYQISVEGTVGAMSAPYEWIDAFGTHSEPVGYTASAALVKRFTTLT